MRKLIFVYNANSGKLNASFDIAHKLLSPSTYQCQLCAITHGVFKEREQWTQFREQSSDDLRFLHKDEFEREFEPQPLYPVVLEETETGLNTLISSEQMANLRDIDDLMAVLQQI